jgi:predicted nucleic acid-binding protein
MIVVSDTSAITSLIQIGREQLLAQLFSRVIIPAAVQAELLAFHPYLPAFIEVVGISNLAAVESLLKQVDRGEAEAIVLTEELAPDFLLVDEIAARELAVARGIRVIGLMGVFLEAKRRGFVTKVGDIITDLEQIAGFRLAPALKKRVLQASGE